MQPGKKIEPRKRSKSSHPIKIHHLSSFGILNSTGLKMIKGRGVPDIEEEEENESKLSVFSGSMPEQPSGYIKCRKHDFL